jgi:hypothetical protein
MTTTAPPVRKIRGVFRYTNPPLVSYASPQTISVPFDKILRTIDGIVESSQSAANGQPIVSLLLGTGLTEHVIGTANCDRFWSEWEGYANDPA